jgi:hypothetical protein
MAQHGGESAAADQYIMGSAAGEGATHQPRATSEEILAIARQIWQRVAASGVAADDDRGNDSLLAVLQADFKDFGTTLPLVLRWMVQMRKFSAKALRTYLVKHAAAKLATRREFLELQAEYPVLLYRAEGRRQPSEVRAYRAAIIESLVAEDAEFLEIQKKAEAELARLAAADDQDRRRRLYDFLLAQKAAAPY